MTTPTQWHNVHGEELSAFIAQGLAAREDEDFAQHLEQHGTISDFQAWITSRNPTAPYFLHACQWLPYCPTLAHPFIIDALDNDAIATIHHDAIRAVNRARHLQNLDFAIAQKICAHIVPHKIHPNLHTETFAVLLNVGAVDVIRNNPDIFLPVIQQDPDQACIEAAHAGWDLATHMGVQPPLNDGYFIACCVGGLMERAAQCNIPAHNHKTLCTAFTLCLYRTNPLNQSNDKSLEYLWDTYPNTPWYKDSQILNFANHAPLSILPQLLEMYHTHALGLFKKMITSLACNCLEHDDLPRFNLLYPYCDPAEHDNVYYSAIAHKKTTALVQLLDDPEWDAKFFKGLSLCHGEEKEWGQAFYSQRQNTHLHNSIPTTTRAVARKM